MKTFFIRSDGKKIHLIDDPFCNECSNPINGSYQQCFWCHRDGLLDNIIQIRTVEYYFERSEHPNHILSNEIRALKFNNRPNLATILGECLVYAINCQYPELQKMDCIVSVPKASKDRVYDQAQLLAMEVSKQTGKPFYNALSINGEINPSYKMNLSERIEQIGGKITSSYNFKQNSVLLIDDICTTGATLRECAVVLRESNAKDIMGLVVGRKVDNLLLSNAGRKYED